MSTFEYLLSVCGFPLCIPPIYPLVLLTLIILDRYVCCPTSSWLPGVTRFEFCNLSMPFDYRLGVIGVCWTDCDAVVCANYFVISCSSKLIWLLCEFCTSDSGAFGSRMFIASKLRAQTLRKNAFFKFSYMPDFVAFPISICLFASSRRALSISISLL